MRVCIAAILLVLCVNAEAQKAFPSYADAPSWNVLTCLWFDCWTVNYQFTSDTTFCGYEYSVGTYQNETTAYVRSDSVRTYVRRTTDCADKEYLMYDYSMQVGDTAYMGYELIYNDIDTTAFYLESIDTVMVMGTARPRYHVLYGYPPIALGEPISFYREMDWIYGLGSTFHPFYSLACIDDACETRYTTLCMDSAGVQLYLDQEYMTCDTTILGIHGLSNDPVVIYPNPATTTVRIQLPDNTPKPTDVRIYDLMGRMVHQQSYNNPVVDVSALPAGNYILQVNGTTRSFRGGLTKQ